MKKSTPESNDQTCGCLIEDLLEDSSSKEERLCSSNPNDIEVFTDPDPEKTSYNFYIKRMTDGLPIIPPTSERVSKFLKYTDCDPYELLGVLAPRMGMITAEKIAINAVMAGCLPQFMPLVQKSVESLSNEKFNLTGINATTHPVSVCVIMNGPVSREVGAGSGSGCLGPGNIANATIGRAIRLCLINIAGAVPGVGDHATMGSPSKYTYAFAEAENESPWEALHSERGFKPVESTVTVMAVEAPQNVNDHRSKSAEDLLDTIVNTASTAGSNNSHVPGEILLIMSPEHAETVSKDGWTREDVKEYLHWNSVVPFELADRGGRKVDENLIVEGGVHLTRSPDDVVLVVAGGVGRHSMISHGFGTSSESISTLLSLNDGTPVHSVEDLKK